LANYGFKYTTTNQGKSKARANIVINLINMYCLFVLFYVLFVYKCVLHSPDVNPIAVKYIILYQLKVKVK